MRYLLIHYVDESRELSAEKTARVETALAAWVDQAVRDGVSLDGARLRPARQAVTIRVRDGEVLVSDGPFAETREQIGGYDLLDCADLDQAIEVASRHPTASLGTIEIRPVRQE